MDDKHLAACIGHRAYEIAHKVIALDLVDADAVLDGDGHVHHIHHGLDAIGHQTGLVHQTGAKRAALHAFAGAAAVEVDLVIAPLRTQTGALRQIGRLAAAQLQGNRVLARIKTKMARNIAMDQGTGGHHLGIEQGVLAEQTVQITAVPICPIHHRRNRHAPHAVKWLIFFDIYIVHR